MASSEDDDIVASRGGGHQVIPTTNAESDDDDEFPFAPPNDGLTLKQTAALACKRIDIGTAVLPKPLFYADVEDISSKAHLLKEQQQQEENGGGGGGLSMDTSTESLPEGAATIPKSATGSTPYARVLSQEFNAVVIEHHLKWAPLCVAEPGPLMNGDISERLGRYDFHHADSIVDWCEKHDICTIKGHVLVWHVTTPKFVEDLEAEEIRKQLKRHIFTVMGHYRGRIRCWDVVNEALAPDGSLAENVFYRKLGPGYIEDCFRWAHEADPDCILLYNDNKVEGVGTPKAEGFYELLADLKAKNVPVHGCGIQAHFNAAGTGRNRPPTPAAVKQQIHRLGKLGLKVNISEMDVRVSKLPVSSSSTTDGPAGNSENLRDVAQRQIYHDILAAALSEPAFDGIWLWGFTDRHTWVHNFYYDDEPCIFDESYQRKPAYYGVRDAIASLTPGGSVGGDGVLLDADIDVNGRPWGHLWMQPDPEDYNEENGAVSGDARPDWEQQTNDDQQQSEIDLDSGVEADVETVSQDNETTDDDLPPIS